MSEDAPTNEERRPAGLELDITSDDKPEGASNLWLDLGSSPNTTEGETTDEAGYFMLDDTHPEIIESEDETADGSDSSSSDKVEVDHEQINRAHEVASKVDALETRRARKVGVVATAGDLYESGELSVSEFDRIADKNAAKIAAIDKKLAKKYAKAEEEVDRRTYVDTRLEALRNRSSDTEE